MSLYEMHNKKRLDSNIESQVVDLQKTLEEAGDNPDVLLEEMKTKVMGQHKMSKLS
jgi:hypothetical protein